MMEQERNEVMVDPGRVQEPKETRARMHKGKKGLMIESSSFRCHHQQRWLGVVNRNDQTSCLHTNQPVNSTQN